MTGARMLAEMEANLGGYDPSRWRVFAYLGSTYIEIHSEDFAVLNIMPGMGFWIITTLTDVIPFWGPIPPDGVDYELTIPSGWSLVALPWTGTDIDLGNIQVTDGSNRYSITSASNNLTQRCLWHYTGSGPHNGYEKLDLSTDRLQCGTGYFFKVLTTDAVRVIFPPVNTVRRDETGERGSPGDEEEPPPPPGGSQQQSPCPDIFNGRLENVAYPRGVHCQYIHRGKLTIGNGVTVPEGTTVTFRADEADIEGSMTVSRGAQVTIQATRVHMRSPFHAEEGALVRIRQP